MEETTDTICMAQYSSDLKIQVSEHISGQVTGHMSIPTNGHGPEQVSRHLL